jgi:hypothetical protein
MVTVAVRGVFMECAHCITGGGTRCEGSIRVHGY